MFRLPVPAEVVVILMMGCSSLNIQVARAVPHRQQLKFALVLYRLKIPDAMKNIKHHPNNMLV